jgi:type I restriction enzyme, S subunit
VVIRKYETAISVVDTFVKDNGKSIVSKGNEVIVPASGETAEDIARASAVIKSGILLGGDLNIIYPNNEIDSIFLAITISNGATQNDLSKRAQGKSVVHVRNADLKEITIHYPNKNEQTKISNYLQQIDTLIAQHQQKHDKLLNLKKSLLEKMYPKQDRKEPEIRFKEFSGDWEEKTLGENSDLLTGNPFDSKKFSKDGIFLVRGINVKRGYLDISEDISEYWPTSHDLEKFLLKDDDVVIQMDGALIGKSYAKIQSKHLPALLVQRVTRIRSSNIDSEFTYQSIQRDFLKYISRIKTETAVPHLSLNDIRSFFISTPKEKEQKKIGNFFKQLDTLLNHHQAQLKKLNNIKQACLEKMFV